MAIQQYLNLSLSYVPWISDRGVPKTRDAGCQRPLAIFMSDLAAITSPPKHYSVHTASQEIPRIVMEGPLPYSSINGPYFQSDKSNPSVIIMIQLNIILQFIFTKVFRIKFVCRRMSRVLHVLPISLPPPYRHKHVYARQMTCNCLLLSMWNFQGEK